MPKARNAMSLVSRLSSFVSMASLVLLFAGCATDKYGQFEPKQTADVKYPAVVPRDYSSSVCKGKEVCKGEEYIKAYDWQLKNAQTVADATKKEVLAKFVASDEAADALLAKIGTSYDGDPVVLTQIAAVTQLVMCPKCPKAPACRKRWVAALKRARANADDGYVRTFCDQQLRVCE